VRPAWLQCPAKHTERVLVNVNNIYFVLRKTDAMKNAVTLSPRLLSLACAALIAATSASAQPVLVNEAAPSATSSNSLITTAPVLGASARLFPDLAFDDAKMRANARGVGSSGVRGAPGYAAHVKNVGLGASKATTMTCTDVADWADVTPGPNMGKITRKTTTWTRNVPALARGQAHSDSIEMYGNDFIVSRNCTIDPQQNSGDSNRANNAFSFSDMTSKANMSEMPAMRKPTTPLQVSPAK
jgi:hypothetical protein